MNGLWIIPNSEWLGGCNISGDSRPYVSQNVDGSADTPAYIPEGLPSLLSNIPSDNDGEIQSMKQTSKGQRQGDDVDDDRGQMSSSPEGDYVFPGDLPQSLSQYLEQEIDIEVS